MPKHDIETLFLPKKYLYLLQDLLKKHVPTATAWAYGSRVTGNAHEGSDLDIVLRYQQSISDDNAGIDALQQALQESTIPILIDVHVWSHLPQSFYPNIENAYIILQQGY